MTIQSKRKRACCVLISAIAVIFVTGLCFIVRPVCHTLITWYKDSPHRPTLKAGIVDDSSRLNQTTATEILIVPHDPSSAEDQLRTLLKRAAAEHLKISIAGARHSQGGHTIYPGGIAIDMLSFNAMSLHDSGNILHVGAGAKWNQILPFLNDHGKSIKVMQSNNSFSVGGSISVNCHGWQTGQPPISSTVESFRIMLADGTITRCSRTENKELFSLALGGYGLFGIILDVDLKITPNELLARKRIKTTIPGYIDALRTVTSDSNTIFTYGRLNVSASHSMESALINYWQSVPKTEGTTTPLRAVPMSALSRAIFRGSVGNDYGKDLRWWAETNISPWIGGDFATRNELLNVGVELFENRSPDNTDILHEYFIPPRHFSEFVQQIHKIVKECQADLLNVTVRDIQTDEDTFLRYANGPMLGFVMLFNQALTTESELKMQQLSQKLIDAALALDGRYYLTYRLHATHDQIRQAYRNLDEFFALKRKYDPDEIFQNEFYRKYAKQR